MNHYTTNEIREAVIAELKDKHQPSYYLSLITKTEEVNALLDAAFKRLPDRLPDDTSSFENQIAKEIGEMSDDDFERINNYGRHQFNRGSMNLDLVKYEDWKTKDRLPDDAKTILPSVKELREIAKDSPDTFLTGALYIIDLIERAKAHQ
jgi:hypothetical protein